MELKIKKLTKRIRRTTVRNFRTSQLNSGDLINRYTEEDATQTDRGGELA